MAGRQIKPYSGGEAVASRLEWGAPGAGRPSFLLVSSDHAPADWAIFARRLAGSHRVIALGPGSAGEGLVEEWRAVAGGAILVAHGSACKAAARLAASGASGLTALVLSDCKFSDVTGVRVSVPVLILRGRQSTLTTHAEAVALRESCPGSRLIEPEECGSWPFGSCPEAAAEAIEWFVSSCMTPVMEYGVAEEAGESEFR